MKSLESYVGNTPLVEINFLHECRAKIYAKLEYMNPSGSVKDRASIFALRSAKANGLVKKGGLVVETTSGNMGISLAVFCNEEGLRLIVVVPGRTMAKEKIHLLELLGVDVRITDSEGGHELALELSKKIAEENGAYWINQYRNPANVLAHYHTTANEILRETGLNITAFVAGGGSCGTIVGVSKRMKEVSSSIRTILVEPLECPMFSKGEDGIHYILGLGPSFIPDNYDSSVIDEIMSISSEDAKKYMKIMLRNSGIMGGISSGAVLCACHRLSKQMGTKDVIVTVFPDSIERILGTVCAL